MIYLDHAATTPVAKEVLDSMLPFLTTEFGNPSSIYNLSKKPREAIKLARAQVASLIHASPENIVFTSGCTEANNTVLKSILATHKKHIITSSIEHASIIAPCQYLHKEHHIDITWLPVDKEGFIDMESLENSIHPGTYLVSIIHANNEIGTLQDINRIIEIAHNNNILVHLDSTQAVGKIPIDVQALNVDFLTLSAHKIYGPKGIGALYVKDTDALMPHIHGGGQENTLRGGTENVACIAGFGKAAEQALHHLVPEADRLRDLQQKLIHKLQTYDGIKLNGPVDLSRRIPGNVNFSVRASTGESIVMQFALRGIAISSGSACSNNSIKPSHVLLAVGNTEQESKNSIRVSFGRLSTKEDMNLFLNALDKIIQQQPLTYCMMK